VSLSRSDAPDKKQKAIQKQSLSLEPVLASDDEVKIYPNPFYSSFRAAFTLKEPAKVQLLLYSMGGLEVFRHTRDLPAGSHVLELQAEVPSGAYIFKLVYGKTIKNSVIIKQ
jgi:hypothetical protein